MKTLSLKLPDELDTRLSAIAKRQRSNKSEVVRNALDAYLTKETMPQQGSVLVLAGDLVGVLEGPGDLSHSDDHLGGYGE